VAVTGAGGGIGAGDRARLRGGRRRGRAARRQARRRDRQAKPIGGAAVLCDVTDADSVQAGFDRVAATFGGLDILVSNAGATPPQGKIGAVDEAGIRQSFELNFYGHQRAAQAAVKIMLDGRAPAAACCSTRRSRRSTRGPNFGPYGLPRPRRCSSRASTRSTTAATASVPTPSTRTASAPAS
jgi:NAD(P)-dependent dehydrogenase (short-subunit alcohol dehydrogenase family)